MTTFKNLSLELFIQPNVVRSEGVYYIADYVDGATCDVYPITKDGIADRPFKTGLSAAEFNKIFVPVTKNEHLLKSNVLTAYKIHINALINMRKDVAVKLVEAEANGDDAKAADLQKESDGLKTIISLIQGRKDEYVLENADSIFKEIA